MLLSAGFFLRFYLPLEGLSGAALMSWFKGTDAGSECRVEHGLIKDGLVVECRPPGTIEPCGRSAGDGVTASTFSPLPAASLIKALPRSSLVGVTTLWQSYGFGLT